MNLFGGTMKLLEHALDVRATRQQVINSNIANEETPGYRAKDLRFQDALTAAIGPSGQVSLRVTNAQHLSGSGSSIYGQIVEIPGGDLPLDGNSVNLERELAKLSDNAMQYKTAAELIAKKFQGLRNAIREGR